MKNLEAWVEHEEDKYHVIFNNGRLDISCRWIDAEGDTQVEPVSYNTPLFFHLAFVGLGMMRDEYDREIKEEMDGHYTEYMRMIGGGE
jgi:hypothetical protein